MKKLLFLAIFAVILTTTSFSQTMLLGDKMWYNYHYGLIPPYDKNTVINKLGTDTVINGLTYRILLITSDSTLTQFDIYRFLRETPEGKVFFRVPGPASNPEYLAYDFSAELGDTVYYHQLDLYAWEDHFIVTFLDSNFIAGRMRKIIGIVGYVENWTEGIGDTDGLIYSGNSACVCDQGWLLVCYFENGNLMYHHSSYPLCYYDNTGTNEIDLDKGTYQVHPNPVIGTSIILLPPQLLQYSGSKENIVEIIDVYGRRLRYDKIPASGEYEIHQSDFVHGIYFYRLKDANIAGKFVVD